MCSPMRCEEASASLKASCIAVSSFTSSLAQKGENEPLTVVFPASACVRPLGEQ